MKDDIKKRLTAAMKDVFDAEGDLTDMRAELVTDATADLFEEALADLAAASDKLETFVKASIAQDVDFIEDGSVPAPAPEFVEMTEEDERRLEGAA